MVIFELVYWNGSNDIGRIIKMAKNNDYRCVSIKTPVHYLYVNIRNSAISTLDDSNNFVL